MAQGPPTPPPTSTTELQDQVRDSVTGDIGPSSSTLVESAVIAPQPAPSIDIYQQVFPQICELALRRDLSELAQYAELFDLKVTCISNAFCSGGYDINRQGRNARSHTRLLVVAPLVLAYLILDDLPLAQLTLARLPDNLRLYPLTLAIGILVTAVSERNYTRVYSHAEVLATLIQQPEFANDTLANLMASMVTTFVGV
ncbi:hypothetical protein V8B97DRAFT_2004129 [Scleroderma yunnanense]